MLRKSRLNNMGLNFQRQSLEYEAIITDLYLIGAVPKSVAESLTGRQINDGLKLPAAVTEALAPHVDEE